MRATLSWLFVVAACMPPPMNVGYVAMDPSGRGGVDVQGQVGGGGVPPRGGAGGGTTMHVEPFVAKRVSIPIGVGVAGTSERGGLAPLRIGVRHRATSFLAWGGGIGPSLTFDRRWVGVAGVADLELVLGTQRPRIGVSVGLRPAVSFDAGFAMFYGLVDPTLAIVVAPQTSLTIAMPFGGWYARAVGGAPFLTGAIGMHRRF